MGWRGMRRSAKGMIVAATTALVLAVGYVAAAASSTSAQTGTLAVTVAYMEHGFHGVVKVFNAARQVVAHHGVQNRHGSLGQTERYFRFALMPAQYKVGLELKKQWRRDGCGYKRAALVRAAHTTHVLLEQNCLNRY
jgi:hypothetical protein